MRLSSLKNHVAEVKLFQHFGRVIFNPSVYLFPRFVVSRADAERSMVDSFVDLFKEVSNGEIVLDAGAGSFRYKKILLEKGYVYESQDFDQGFDFESRGKHTYTCDLEKIPVRDGYFDLIICTQVLEHLPKPSIVFAEFSRVLRSGGTLGLTTNFLFPKHGEPYDYFRFTDHSLRALSESTDFSVLDIKPRGGFFTLLAKVLFDFPEIFKSKLLYEGASPHGPRKLSLSKFPVILVSAPLVFILDIACTILAFIVSLFDFLDKKNRFTLGYQLIAIKK